MQPRELIEVAKVPATGMVFFWGRCAVARSHRLEDFGKRLRLAMISSAARDGGDLRPQVSRPRRMGFCWVGEVVFAGVTHIVGRDLRSDLADPQLRPGWRIDGLVHDLWVEFEVAAGCPARPLPRSTIGSSRHPCAVRAERNMRRSSPEPSVFAGSSGTRRQVPAQSA